MSNITIQELARNIVNAVQAEAAKVPGFDYGAIRLLFVPKIDMAEKFVGGFGLDCEMGLIYPIKLGASHTRPAQGDEKECDCSGYAALKIQGCAYALKNGLGRKSGDMPESAETWGRASDKGCVVYEISMKLLLKDCSPSGIGSVSLLRLYVSVSGADSIDDERCAFVAGDIIRQWCYEYIFDGDYGDFTPCLVLENPD